MKQQNIIANCKYMVLQSIFIAGDISNNMTLCCDKTGLTCKNWTINYRTVVICFKITFVVQQIYVDIALPIYL
jgi:hypothetical protein